MTPTALSTNSVRTDSWKNQRSFFVYLLEETLIRLMNAIFVTESELRKSASWNMMESWLYIGKSNSLNLPFASERNGTSNFTDIKIRVSVEEEHFPLVAKSRTIAFLFFFRQPSNHFFQTYFIVFLAMIT